MGVYTLSNHLFGHRGTGSWMHKPWRVELGEPPLAMTAGRRKTSVNHSAAPVKPILHLILILLSVAPLSSATSMACPEDSGGRQATAPSHG